ncbi:MAG: class I SAM-dependent methyltransferase [Acetobacteraceae bacterium]|nr:class I SAM-dependent methyltransferase [Acetobacteraceae bacterium]
MSETFSPDWLALREPFDRAARSPRLAAALAEALPARPRLIDLGAGTGSLFRWLAPRLARAQVWTLVDADAALLDEAFARIAAWAEGAGFRVTAPGRALLVHTPHGAWRVEALARDVATDPGRLPLRDHDAVVCSALLDLVSARWLADLASALRSPFAAFLSVDGRDVWLPRDADDRLIARAFARDMGRDKGFGPALGPRAPAQAARLFAALRLSRASPRPRTGSSHRIGHAMLDRDGDRPRRRRCSSPSRASPTVSKRGASDASGTDRPPPPCPADRPPRPSRPAAELSDAHPRRDRRRRHRGDRPRRRCSSMPAHARCSSSVFRLPMSGRRRRTRSSSR